MTQMNLNSLAILSIESEFVKTIDFSDIIDDFAIRKAWMEGSRYLNCDFLKALFFFNSFLNFWNKINFNLIKIVISIYLISQCLYVILSYNQILDSDGGPEKNRRVFYFKQLFKFFK